MSTESPPPYSPGPLEDDISSDSEPDTPGESTSLLPGSLKPAGLSYPQTVFNVVNLIVGLGLLALPFCFKLGGWIFGSIVLATALLVMNHTAKLVIRCIQHGAVEGVSVSSFPDLADLAFGGHLSRKIIALGLVAELYLASIAILIVAADNLIQLYPSLPPTVAKPGLGLLMWLSTFLDLSLLSYTSLLGTLGSLSLVCIVIYNGLSKPTSPGSLRDPMPTELLSTPCRVILGLGIVVSCLSGHAVYPSIYSAMRNRGRALSMVNLSFLVVGGLYAAIGIAGYLMFGLETENEVTKNLLGMGFNEGLNTIIVWLMVVVPVTKFALLMEPVAGTVSGAIWSAMDRTSVKEVEDGRLHDIVEAGNQPSWLKPGVKTVLSVLAVSVSLLFPKFEAILALIGSLLSSSVSIIFPAACFLRIFGGQGHGQGTRVELLVASMVLLIGVFVASIGTFVSISEAIQ